MSEIHSDSGKAEKEGYYHYTDINRKVTMDIATWLEDKDK